MAYRKQKKLVDRASLKRGDTIDHRYKIRKLLGEGSFGAVYLVEDMHSDTLCALKIQRLWEVAEETRQQLCDRFDEEYKTGLINCECLVHSLARGEVNGNPYIVMEYCPNGDLTPLLGKAGSRAVFICHDILVGLNALHMHGKVHRDLKPENILFKANGHAVLTDFGIVGNQSNHLTATDWRNRPKEIFGTHAYMAPEQRAMMKGGVTKLPTTDIFSFGVLTYQLLTGRLPFGRLETFQDLPEYQNNVEKGRWDDSPLRHIEYGEYWWKLIEACLRTDYTMRIRSAAAADKLLPRIAIKKQETLHPLTVSYKPLSVTHGFCLRVLNGQKQDCVYNLTAHRNGRPVTLYTVGRQKDNDICMLSGRTDYLSRHHCTLEADREARQWKVLDGWWDKSQGKWVPSRNGTFVNSSPVRAVGYYLQPGDIITLGGLTLRFENY